MATSPELHQGDATKVFNDPIHGHMEFDRLCVKIIDTPQFQRLRDLKQLGGGYFVYPGASHNRFEHSLGVCHLAGLLVTELQRRQPELDITKEDILCVQIAGLCHDLGHGPFSHVFDNKFIHEMRPEKNWKHEDASLAMFDYMVTKNELEKEFGPRGLTDLHGDFIKQLIMGKPKEDVEKELLQTVWYKKEKAFLYEIVANKRNGVDVDKWDYFQRDCHHLGMTSSFDHKRFIKFARVITVDGESQICYRDKEAFNMYQMFHTRFTLHRRAYQHKTVQAVELMLVDALKEADEFLKIPGDDGGEYSVSECIDHMDAYTKLTDSVIHQIMLSKEDDQPSGEGQTPQSKEDDQPSGEGQTPQSKEEDQTSEEGQSPKSKEKDQTSEEGQTPKSKEKDQTSEEGQTPQTNEAIKKKKAIERAKKIVKDLQKRNLYHCVAEIVIPVPVDQIMAGQASEKKSADEAEEIKTVVDNEVKEQLGQEQASEKKSADEAEEIKTVVDNEVKEQQEQASEKKPEADEEIQTAIENEAKLAKVADRIRVQNSKLDYGKKTANPVNDVRFYKKNDPDEAVEFKSVEVSFLVPQFCFMEHLVRVFFRREETDKQKDVDTWIVTLKNIVKTWCDKKQEDVKATEPEAGAAKHVLVTFSPTYQLH